jgi:hypothetical protein
MEFIVGILRIFPFTPKDFSPFMKLFSFKFIHLMSWVATKFISGLALGCKPKAKVVTIFIFVT